MSSVPWHTRRAGFVTGLQAEARIAALLGPVQVGGGMPAGAAEAAGRLVADGATALVSFGLCGGLDPALRPGALVVPRMVLSSGHRYATDATLSAALGGWSAEFLLAGETAAADAATKQRLFCESGAVAIDLESGMVAQIAARAGLPFTVLRAVCDPADMRLPPAALIALGSDGRISIRAVASSLLREPSQIFDLIALGRAAAAARAALVRRVGDVGHGRFLVA